LSINTYYKCNHPDTNGECNHKIYPKKDGSTSIDTGNAERHLNSHNKGDMSQSHFITNSVKEYIDSLLVNVIVHDLESFEGIISPSKIKLYNGLNKLYKPPCSDTLKDRVSKKYSDSVILEKNYLRNINSGYIDFDGWSGNNNIYYLTLNLHFLSDDFKLVRRNLGTVTFSENKKSADVKAAKIIKICQNFNVWEKICGCISDGAELSVAKEINLSNFWCVCHIINCIIKDNLFVKKKNVEDEEIYLLEELKKNKKK